MNLTLTIRDRATCRLALELYAKKLDTAAKAVEACERSPLDLKGIASHVAALQLELKEPAGQPDEQRDLVAEGAHAG